MQMVRTPTWILERDVGAAFFRLRRTAQPMSSFEEMSQVAEKMARALGGIDREHIAVLVDLREGGMRNDAEFEKAAAPYQKLLLTGWRRVAVLVKTPAGRLQVERLTRGVAEVRIFTDEKAALAFLAEH
jgi:hypothetical protein